jgi:predicted nucleotidyltransferase
MGILESNKKRIRKLCKLNRVKSLHSFGSVNTADFHEGSDVDMVVEFNTNDPLEYSESYFNLKFDLENLLQRHIDLLEFKAIKNPFLLQQINKSKQLIYGE